MLKNTASQKIALFAFDYTTGQPKTGDAANITAYVNKDWGGITVLVDTSATEIDATNAKGWYLFDLTQAETNADLLHFSGKSSTANISVVGQLMPTYVAQTGDSFARLGAPAGASQAADIASIKTDTGTTIPGRLPAALSAAGFMKADLFAILATAFTEGAAGRIAANFKQFFNVSGATGTQDLIPAVTAVTTTTTTTNLTNAPPDSAGVTTLLSRIPAALFSGITSLANWLGAAFGKQAADATAITEIRARGAGSGGFDATTDSQEALRDSLATAATLGTPAGASIAADIAATLAAIPSANTVRDAILNLNLGAAYGNKTVLQAIKVALGVGAGVSTGAGTTSVEVKTPDGSTVMFTATIDANGNITAIAWGTIP